MSQAVVACAPKVSVVMPVYNGEKYLSQAIDSILEQTFTDFEVVIVNDGSTDGTAQILHEYKAKDPRIHLINQENAGVTQALITGCAAARGQYIARNDADDCSTPHRFESQVALLDRNDSLVAATGDIEHFQNDGTVVNIVQLRGDARLIRLFNCFCNYIGGHGQVMFRRETFEEAGGYDPSFRLAQDYDLWSRLLRHGDFGNVPEIVYRYRTGHDNISNTSADRQASSAIRTCRREFKAMTDEDLGEEEARVLLNFWWMRPPVPATTSVNISVSRAMRKVALSFFRQHPDLRKEEFRIYRDITAKWWWWTKRVPPYSIERAVYIRNFLVWGMRAIWARARSGDAGDA